jgi:hypothetical protein
VGATENGRDVRVAFRQQLRRSLEARVFREESGTRQRKLDHVDFPQF